MKLEQSFDVAAPLDRVWQALIDVEQVAPCLPGATVTGRNEDGSYNGSFSVKIGPTTAVYSGKLAMDALDESAHTAKMHAQGTDKRGQGGARATISSRLSPLEGAGTRVEVITDYQITGRLARFGRGGMIEDISERLLREFARCLQQSLGREKPVAAEEAAVAPEAAAETAPEVLGAAGTVPAGEAAEAVTAAEAVEAAAETAGAAAAAAAAEAQPAAAVPEASAEVPTPQVSEPVQGVSLVASVLWERVRRNPMPAVAMVIGFLLAFVVLRRGRR